jgi:hypothetical protein
MLPNWRNRDVFCGEGSIAVPLPPPKSSDSAWGSFSSCDDAEAVVVVLCHIVDQIDLPGQVFAHRVLAVLAVLAWREEHIVGLVRHSGRPRLEHAGMLEDMSSDGWKRWREGMNALALQPNVNVKLSGLGTFVHACRSDVMGPIIKETVENFRRETLPVWQ